MTPKELVDRYRKAKTDYDSKSLVDCLVVRDQEGSIDGFQTGQKLGAVVSEGIKAACGIPCDGITVAKCLAEITESFRPQLKVKNPFIQGVLEAGYRDAEVSSLISQVVSGFVSGG